MGAIQKLGANFICNAVKLLSVGACEKYMTPLFILHSPFMPESMMASGKRGHSELCTLIESRCIAALIFYYYADTSLSPLFRKRKTIISKCVSITYILGFISIAAVTKLERFLGLCWENKQTKKTALITEFKMYVFLLKGSPWCSLIKKSDCLPRKKCHRKLIQLENEIQAFRLHCHLWSPPRI